MSAHVDHAALAARGFSYQLLPPTPPATESLLVSYYTYTTLTLKLQQLAASSPLASLHTMGRSVQGRELWYMKISDNVAMQEDEPEVRFSSTMHGDEPVGMQLCVELIFTHCASCTRTRCEPTERTTGAGSVRVSPMASFRAHVGR